MRKIDKDIYWAKNEEKILRLMQAIMEIFRELERAENIHPTWPADIFEALAIIGEEFGEAQKAALDIRYGKADVVQLQKELTQLAAMCIRILMSPIIPPHRQDGGK